MGSHTPRTCNLVTYHAWLPLKASWPLHAISLIALDSLKCNGGGLVIFLVDMLDVKPNYCFLIESAWQILQHARLGCEPFMDRFLKAARRGHTGIVSGDHLSFRTAWTPTRSCRPRDGEGRGGEREMEVSSQCILITITALEAPGDNSGTGFTCVSKFFFP